MTFQANDWLRRWLVHPLALRLSSESDRDQPAFSVAAALKGPKSILIIPDGRAGGLFLGASQFWAIRQRYPDSEITLLVQAQKQYIAREIPFVNNVLVYEDFLLPLSGKTRDVVRRLTESAFDIAFLFSTEESLCPAYYCYKSGAHIRIGFQRDDFPSVNVRIVPRPEPCYESERLALLLRTLGIPQVREHVSWSVSRETAKRIRDRFLVARKPDERFVGLDVSSSSGSRPTPKQLLAIAEQTSKLPDARTLVFFDYRERKTANRIKDALGPRALLFQTDDLPKLVALLEVCDRLIACNTDLFHLAMSMGRPVTGILSAPDVLRWVPPEREGVDILEYEVLKHWSPHQVGDAMKQRALPAEPVSA